ncbi:MAG: hypothetical protein NUW01_09040 [Gemmatimonadaceae bacterium]|nr:hypothetical protein [Gemmatimonadaceae bacterium]
MDDATAAVLREPFPPEQVGKLPKLTCKACSQATGRVCGEHTKERCAACGNWISTAHIDLDYVGHAAATDRLLQADPGFTWEPLARDEHGLPVTVTSGLLADEQVGLWINLTVAGVTRPGFGGGKNIKEAIGDAIRNAAMRFGVALDLWSKEDLHKDSGRVDELTANGSAPLPPSGGEPEPAPNEPAFVAPQPREQPTDGGDPARVLISFGKYKGRSLGDVHAENAGYLAWLVSDKYEAKTTETRRIVGAARLVLGMAVPVAAGDGDFNPPHDDSDIPF